MIIRTYKKALIFTILFLLVSCVGGPPVLYSSTELVPTNQTQLGKNISETYYNFLSNKNIKESKTINQFEIKLGQFFTSALGHNCRLLFVSFVGVDSSLDSNSTEKEISNQIKRIVCKPSQSQQWVLIPSIVQNNNPIIFSLK